MKNRIDSQTQSTKFYCRDCGLSDIRLESALIATALRFETEVPAHIEKQIALVRAAMETYAKSKAKP